MEPQKLTDREIPAVMEYIGSEREINLFFEGDIERYGLEGEIVELFAFGDPWDCLVLRFFQNYCIYSRNRAYDAASVASFFSHRKVQVISGKEELLAQIAPYYPGKRFQGTYLCKCDATSLHQPADDPRVRRLTVADAPALEALYLTIGEFGYQESQKEEKTEELAESLKGSALAFGLFENGMLVSACYATARTKRGAMVVGVATREGYRNRGYASLLVSRLCKTSFDEGLSFLCLFYDNPKTGSIYRKLGFSQLGRWAMIKLHED